MDWNVDIIQQRSERVVFWKKYANTLFKDERRGTENNIYESGPRVLKKQVEKHMDLMTFLWNSL